MSDGSTRLHLLSRRWAVRQMLGIPAAFVFGGPALGACASPDANRRIEEGKQAAQDAVDKGKDAGSAALGTAKAESIKRTFSIDRSRVDWTEVVATNWYGNTGLAYQKRTEWYSQTRGPHSGLDWLVPKGTDVQTGIERKGTVISVGGNPQPRDWAAAPNAVAIDYARSFCPTGTSPART